ncbi:DNA polymerase Y family protein [Rhizobium leguminosarum]|uniref:DNA-directed DNA polymerase n=1 Tax=Rhizobium leguminosarum TaxID=384 RepID=A0A7M3DI88_RHILE|nr:DNA polymerase Y family protein [Rhizobium leguminosarum]QIO75640.1 DNA polymerase Y family protein [Rhizobium leguminosarum bv. trifolii]QIO82652.1 DNA polymerase Y family protein [Rhizobium leguminosarum bv. trifolii]TAX49871.1 DNA polymerase Y family protein [Rhizobium leguminosarum]TAY41337.1 DNA polymerase Y family protein [Rhizobium leguminosarum]TBY29695.1 DNA polymerase Y family protein [Rhizobium leguminosarum bv. viciae]
MPRVVSIFFPDLPTDRIRRADPVIPVEEAIAVISKSGSKRWVSAADAAARKVGLHVGIPAAKAQALFQGLRMIDADPAADAAALERITMWALSQYSPIVAIDPPNGIVMDTEGADHLQGGEERMLTSIANRFRAKGLTTRVAIADTWGAAHACARAINRETVIVPSGETIRAVERLPISLLRLPEKIVSDLRTLGFRTTGELSATPRAPLAFRFGPEVGRRLDQMFGRVFEPIDPIRSPELVEVSRAFAEPIGAPETINKYVGRLVVQLVAELQRRGLGVRRTDLIVEKVDGTRQAIRAGTAKPVRDVAWLTKLFRDRTEKIEPGFGIEKLTLVAVMSEPLEEKQKTSSLIDDEDADITPLIDVFGNRGQRVFRVAPVASDVPERSVQRIAAVGEEVTEGWVHHWRRPVRLFARPDPIEAIALLPDHPPASITWRGKRHRVKRADGPERVFGEWWMRDSEFEAVRDYFVVENEIGERYWIFRSGDGIDPETGSHKWFMHGIFG